MDNNSRNDFEKNEEIVTNKRFSDDTSEKSFSENISNNNLDDNEQVSNVEISHDETQSDVIIPQNDETESCVRYTSSCNGHSNDVDTGNFDTNNNENKTSNYVGNQRFGYHDSYAYNNGHYGAMRDTISRRELKKFKRSMYSLMAVLCVFVLVLGVAGGGIAGYALGGGFKDSATQQQSPSKPLFPQLGGDQDSNDKFNDNSDNNPNSNPSLNKPNLVTSTTDAGAMSVQDIYATYSNAVVSIYVETTVNSGYYYYGQQQTYTQESAGSGVIISADGYIATNNHVIEGATKIRVCLQNGEEYVATVIGADEETDVALIKIDAKNLVSTPIGDSDDLRVGDRVCVIGNPLGKLSGTLTVGYVSALRRELTIDESTGVTMSVIQTDAAVNPGNSGGALLNESGELVGIIFAKTANTNVEGLGYAIPINETMKVINDLIDFGYVRGRPAFGIEVISITSPTYAMMYRVNYLGVYVSKSTNPDNGFESGDLIVTIDGEEIGDYGSLVSAIKKLSVGDTAEVEVMRNGEKKTLKVPVIELKN